MARKNKLVSLRLLKLIKASTKKNLTPAVLLAVITILFGIFLKINSPQIKPKTSQEFAYTAQNVPELVEILAANQQARLAAAQKLVERVDVEAALEILENSPLPHTGEGHLAVHQIGFYAYKKYGVDSILKCKDYFLYACYHGAIIEAATNQGFEVIAKMANRCKASAARYFQCVHASGHSILAIWDYNLPEALKTCDSLFEKETKFPDVLSSCHNGTFMENLFGVHDWGKRETPKRDWLSDDMFFPCNAFAEKYQKGCWLNQAARIYQMFNGDIVKTKETCEKIGKAQYSSWCMDNLARQIHPLTNGDISQVFRLCELVGGNWRENCIIVNAGSYYSVGDRIAGITICQRITPAAQPACFSNIVSQIPGDDLADKDKEELCRKIGGSFEKQCLWQISI